MPQTLLVLPAGMAARLPGLLATAGIYLARDRATDQYRQLTCERQRGRVTVVFMTSPEWARRLDATIPPDAVLVGVQRSSMRFWRRDDDRELLDRVVRLLEPYAVSEPMRLGDP